MDTPLSSARVALIGCGALGSAIADILVRGGVHQLLLVDDDRLSAGNLVRHTLTGRDIGRKKAKALADQLMSITPTGTVETHPESVPVQQTALEELLKDVNVVVDCTGSDDVLVSLAHGWWSLPRMSTC